MDTAEITGSAYPDTRLGIGAEPSDPADTPSPPVPPPGDVETAVEVAAASAERSDPYLLLAGLPPVNEYLGFIHQAGDGRRQDLASWVEAWRTASSQRELLARAEIGVCDTAPAASLSPHLQHLADDLLSDRTVIRSFSMMPMRVGMVDLDTLIVYQRHINLGFARQLQRQLPPATEEDLFRFCLLDRSRPPVRAVRMGDAWLFASVSNDLRIVDPVILRGDEVPGLVAPGMVEFIVGVAVGYGTNLLNVVRLGSRNFLSNGSHHAYALRAAGITQAPALIQQAARIEDLMAVPQVQQNAPFYLSSPRPPLLRDFFDTDLHVSISAPKRATQVTVPFQPPTVSGIPIV